VKRENVKKRRRCRICSALHVFTFSRLQVVLACLIFCRVLSAADKPTIAVFPLAGSASDSARDKVGFALRSKINRDGTFDAIDGPTMADLAGGPVALDTSPDALQKLLKDEKPAVLIWGELNGDAVQTLKLKLLDLRQPAAEPRGFEKTITQPTQLRFAIEEALQSITGIKQFAHPSEEPLSDDPAAAALWKTNPNLLVAGNFADSSRWTALLRSEAYAPPIGEQLPEMDKVSIYRLPGDEPGTPSRNVLAMRLSEGVAQGNGLACISEPFAIKPDRRYRISLRYQSDGPSLHVFVKGYFTGSGIDGKPAPIEAYRRQVPPSGPTHGQWVTIVTDLNPQNANHQVETLRVDLYAYLNGGLVMFEDVEVKEIGPQTLHATDAALRPATTQP
jgi:hypothetical protein